MNQIALLGDKILKLQRDMGLSNPLFFQNGLSQHELKAALGSLMLEPSNELYQLFTWRNGVMMGKHVAMRDLWLLPGYYLLSFKEMLSQNSQLASAKPAFSHNCYPLTSSGTADHHFIDTSRPNKGRLAVYYDAPESGIIGEQIYDTIESMFATILRCYEEGVFFIGEDGSLQEDLKAETLISIRYNPRADYWRRKDLF